MNGTTKTIESKKMKETRKAKTTHFESEFVISVDRDVWEGEVTIDFLYAYVVPSGGQWVVLIDNSFKTAFASNSRKESEDWARAWIEDKEQWNETCEV